MVLHWSWALATWSRGYPFGQMVWKWKSKFPSRPLKAHLLSYSCCCSYAHLLVVCCSLVTLRHPLTRHPLLPASLCFYLNSGESGQHNTCRLLRLYESSQFSWCMRHVDHHVYNRTGSEWGETAPRLLVIFSRIQSAHEANRKKKEKRERKNLFFTIAKNCLCCSACSCLNRPRALKS